MASGADEQIASEEGNPQVEGPLPEAEEEIDAALDEKLPFPNARVVRILKENMKKEHQLRKEVRLAANNLVGQILADIAKAMDEEEFFTLGMDHFNRASRKYRTVDLQLKRMENTRKLLERQRSDLEEKIMHLEHLDE
ncbi:MAG: hypothetical protein NT157_03625 [Candidatus Micrarchaeota archaeon]|nr:hypothetical protein [Candidatus Micrarchaeota archaeon]